MSVSVEIGPWQSAPFALAGETVFAVGDVHGCAAQLGPLLGTIHDLARDAPVPRRLVWLGDMIDRGPDNIGVLRQWAEGPQDRGVERVDRLIGNHEILMLLALRGGALASKAATMWLSERMGGATVLAEMRAAVRDPQAPIGYALAREALGRHVVDLLLTERAFLRLGNTLFVHGGLDGHGDPDGFLARPWRAGVNARWAWITRGFLDWTGGFGGTLVVHGHTPPAKHRTFSGMADTNIFAHDRLCLDGGSALTGLVVARRARRRPLPADQGQDLEPADFEFDSSGISFSGEGKFPRARAPIPGKTRPRAATTANFARAATSLWAMDRSIRLRLPKDARAPLPIIGVGRALVQGGAHDHAHRTAPLQWRS